MPKLVDKPPVWDEANPPVVDNLGTGFDLTIPTGSVIDEIGAAIERVMVGPEKKDRVISEKRKKLVAYHEAGHAVVGAVMPDYDPVQKISIIPRGQAGGLTFFTPSEERMESGLYSRSYLQNQMAVALGGRVAEEIIYGEDEVTTGASNDLKQVPKNNHSR